MSSTTPDSANSSRYLDFDEYVDLKLQKTRSTIKTTDILVALAGVAAMFLGYLLTFVVFDQWVVPGGFGIGLRWTLLSSLLVLTAAWLGWKVGVPYLRTVNRLFAAREIENADPELKSNLLNLVDLRAAGRDVNPSILRALEKNAAVQLQKIDVSQAIDHQPLMRMAYVLLAVVVLFCLYALFSPKKISNSIWRSLFPAAELNVATRTEIVKVHPGDVTVLARERLEVVADISGEVPEKVWLLFTTADGKFRDEALELRTDGEGPTKFKGLLSGENGQGLLQDMTYVVRAGDAVSPTYHISVNQPPSATVDRIAYSFPPYMKLDSLEQPGGQIDAWEGTKVTLTAHTNLRVKTATIEFLDVADEDSRGDDLPMTVASDGQTLTASWNLAFRMNGTSAKFYRIQCKTESEASDPKPTQYTLNIRPDQPPEVAFLEPVRDMEVPANAVIPLLIEARDPDFELSYVNLHIKRNGQPIDKELLSNGREQRVLLKYDLKLERLVLKPGDLVEIWGQALDNRHGLQSGSWAPRPNSRVTPELKLKIVERISDKDAKQKLADDRANRDRQFEEAKQEQNGEPAPKQPTPETPGERTDRTKQEVKPPEPMPPNPPERDQKNETDGDKGNQNGEKSKGSTGGKNQMAGESGQKQTQPGEKGNPGNQPLNTDGTDDQNALKEAFEKLVKPHSDQKQPPKSGQTQPEKNQPDKTGSSEQGHEPKPGGDPMSNDTPQPGENGAQANPPKVKPDAEGKGAKPPTTKPGNSSDKPDPGGSSTPMPAPMPKPDPAAVEPPKNQPGNPTTPPNGDQPPAPDKATQPEKTAQGKSPDSPSGTEPMKNNDATSPGANSPDPAKPGDKAKSDQPGETPKPGEGAGKKPGAEDGAGSDDKNNATAKPKSDATNPPQTGEQPGAAAPSPAKSPMKNGSSPNKTGDGEGQREQTAEKPNAEPKPATGDETGLATPDKAPKTDPTQAKDPKGLERDPKLKPETRPGNAKANDPNNPAKAPADSETKNPKPTGEGQEKIKLEQEPTDKPQTPKSEQKPDPRPGDPNAKNEDLKGKGTPQQRSKTGSGGEEGSGKEDSQGKDGSNNSGEGSETDRPGKQPTTEKKTGPKSNGAKEPGEGTEGAEGGPKKPGGDKSASGKPGGAGKPDSKGNSQSGGDQQGGEPKPGGQAGGKPAGGKPGDGEKKPGGGGGAGGKGGTPQGGNGPTRQGSGEPGENVETPGGSAATTDDGDEANLEFNRQAAELVLKRLQKDLDRGEVDPELLEKLGWTQEEMRQFTERLNKQLQQSKTAEDSPESLARRQQFEEMLKSLDLNRGGTKRTGENSPQREVNQIESRRGAVPKEYRSVYEKFSRDATRQKPKVK